MERRTSKRLAVNNAFYDTLEETWYEGNDNPTALLRAESQLKLEWILSQLKASFGEKRLRILDVGCGGGFLANALASRGHAVTGIDLSEPSLAVARRHDPTRSVDYRAADATRLPFKDACFDVVSAMDFLEHVETPTQVVAEASRVLRPGGEFYFHTFNRNPLAWLIAIQGVKWFVKNTPPHLHVLHLFIKPAELRQMCQRAGLEITRLDGCRPRLSRALWQLLRTGEVPPNFTFTTSRYRWLAYIGGARRI